ncbi:ATP-binding protein [Rhodococcus sp. I2R]|uniref:ATP-binding protein n=1 Tax=Rhodococcus sp. I2R TaxID=2855445 RepID=UPI001E5C28FA|nr:ATP-binding protein [Rhodococcus sp. I2R]MCC8930824.1 ATP-binding protein [Rhodococcus sp. I2R]
MIRVIVGPPCAGKSTYITENAAPGDTIVDFDALAKAFGSIGHHDTPLPMRRVVQAARSAAIAQILMGRVENAWVIDTDPTRMMQAQYRRAGAEIILLDPGLATCLERATADERPDWTAEQIRRWYRLRITA